MSAITPIPTARISDQLANSLLLEQLRSNQTALLRLQQEISTGRRVIVPSDDAPAAARAVDLQRLLERKAQVKTNLQTNQTFLTASDSALSSVADLLNEAKGLAVSSSGSTITQDQRTTAAQQIDSILEQLVNTANQQFNGRYLFAGSNTGSRPFTLKNGYVQYSGNETTLSSYSDIDLLFSTNLTGSEVFGALSAQPASTVDLNPTVTADTPLSDLNGGDGVQLGSISVSDGSHVRTIDLSGAATLGDVKQLLEAQPAGGSNPPVLQVQITNDGLQVSLSGGGALEIREVGSGTTAATLGILATNNATPTVVGSDLNPRLTGSTQLANILGTRAQARISSSGNNNDIVIDALQRGAAANGYTIQFTDSGAVTAGSETVSLSGNTFTVDIDSGNSTAAQVVAALNNDPNFSAQFHASLPSDESAGDQPVSLGATATTAGGSGIEFDQSSGLRITNGGQSYTLDISSAKSVEDLLNVINGAGAGLDAQINSAGTGITIRSRISGGDFSIGENGGNTATQLGLRTFSSQTQLSSLNHGLGVHTLSQQNVDGNDFAIQLEDGTMLQFRLNGETTVGDVINTINNAPGNGGKLVAQLAANGNGIELVSNVAGSTPFQVQQENNSQAAIDLGLIPSGSVTSAPAVAGGGVETITGSDVSPGETDSIFNALIRLSGALRAGDQTGINRAAGLIDGATSQLNFSRAELGARQQALDTMQGRLDTETTDIQSALSNEIDVDLPTAITSLTAQQAAFQASLQVAGQLFKLSLLDYL
jgi:flagellin-like hook-associated protein FlgL